MSRYGHGVWNHRKIINCFSKSLFWLKTKKLSKLYIIGHLLVEDTGDRRMPYTSYMVEKTLFLSIPIQTVYIYWHKVQHHTRENKNTGNSSYQ